MLKFHPRPGLLVRWPESSRYAGRTFDAATRGYVPDAEPIEAPENSDAGRRFVELVRRDGALWPADAHTASVCGVAFVALTRDAEGDFVPAKEVPPPVGPSVRAPRAVAAA